jgi:regulator of ribonuclease activity A
LAELGLGQRDILLSFGGLTIHPGDYIYADNNGVLVSRRKLL